MSEFYLAIVLTLMALAIMGIVVGVANDAVNFLNTSFGSKVASMKVIMIMATIGLFFGTISSNGMMEIARKGLFFPQYITFEAIIFLFFAVMISNIIILNFFNILGLPTSTTVSLIFNLLGATLGIAIVTYKSVGVKVIDFVNAEKSITIISGILLSVLLSLIFGIIIQFIVRLVFGFNFLKKIKYFGGIWGSIVLTAILYFLFIKGFKDSIFVNTNWFKWILANQQMLILVSFVLFAIILQVLVWLKVNIFKGIVLIGTLSLAMSFAGNDLVNFIGVPLAAKNAYDFWSVSNVDANKYFMEALNQPIIANFWYLLASAIAMILTLWFSKQARYVTQTEINLTRQDAGYERFGSTEFSRAIVRISVNTAEFFGKITPPTIKKYIENQFDTKLVIKQQGASFDLIRASVTLMVASILIAVGTSLKLPLSTTYVTFITAMGTSLADRAWGKESAVYRVTGVISVITGWFITGIASLFISLLIAIFLFYTKFIGIGIIILFVVWLVLYSKKFHKQRVKQQAKEAEIYSIDTTSTDEEVFEKSLNLVNQNIKKSIDVMSSITNAFINKNRKKLKSILENSDDIRSESKRLKQNVFKIVRTIKPDNLLVAQFYTQITDALRDLSNAIYIIAEKLYLHIENSHDVFDNQKIELLKLIANNTNKLLEGVYEIIKNKNFEIIDELKELRALIIIDIENSKVEELKTIQKGKAAIIISDLFLNTLVEYKNINIFAIRLAKAIKRYYKSLKSDEV